MSCVRKSVSDLPVKNMGMDMKNPATAHARLTLDFCRYLLVLKQRRSISKLIYGRHLDLTHRPLLSEALTNLTANRNWIAQTSRQHRFKDKESAQRASVTS